MEPLDAPIRKYAWGDPAYLPGLQGRPSDGTPEAELWVGAHPQDPALLPDGRSLHDAIAADPVAMLGARVAACHGELPFLAKILTAAQPLSIQAHPDVEQARAGFDREDREGVPADARERVYRDPNHKPELICALTDFEALCGLVTRAEAAARLDCLLPHAPDSAELVAFAQRLDVEGPDEQVLADVVAWLLHQSDAEAQALVRAVLSATAARAGVSGVEQHDLAAVLPMLDCHHHDDIGVAVALLMHHVVLAPGEALFLGAGNLHCYLGGAAVEVMAASDNVVRGGLTAKHIDVDELLEVVDFTPAAPAVQVPTDAAFSYDVPVADFSLTRLLVGADEHRVAVSGPELLLVTDGSVHVDAASGQRLRLGPAEPVFVPPSEGTYTVSGDGTLFRVTVGT